MAWLKGRLGFAVVGVVFGLVFFSSLALIGWGDNPGGVVSYSSFGWMLIGSAVLGFIVALDKHPRGERLDSFLVIVATLAVGAFLASFTKGDCVLNNTVIAPCPNIFTFRQSLYFVYGCFGVGMGAGFLSRIFWRVKERAGEPVAQ